MEEAMEHNPLSRHEALGDRTSDKKEE